MKSLKISVVGFACTLALVVMRGAVSAPASTNGPTRNFVFTYLTKIPALSPDDKVSRMWIPLPQSDRYQTIRNLKIRSEEHTSELQSRGHLVWRLRLEKKNTNSVHSSVASETF